MPCPHVATGTVTCACGHYRRGCLDCGTCYDCLAAAAAPVAQAAVDARDAAVVGLVLLECPRCLVVRRRPDQGMCDRCGGRPGPPGLTPPEVHEADRVKPAGPAEPGMAGLG